MATNTVSLNVVKWGYVDQTHPDTHYTVNTGSSYEILEKANQNKILFFGLQAIPTALRRYRITGVDVYLNPVNGGDVVWFSSIYDDFDPTTMTWNSGRPEVNTWDLIATRDSGTGDAVCSKTSSYLDPTVDMTTMQQIFQNRGFAAWGRADPYYVRPVRSNGGTNMIRVTYDSEQVLHGYPVPIEYPTGIVDPRISHTFSWELRKHAKNWYCMDEVFHQASAKFCWKLETDENWTVINLTDEMSVTIPADTWPTAARIHWYVETVDEDGVTAQCNEQIFSTPTPWIFFTDYPSGKEVDIRNQLLFAWKLSTPVGDYDQESAALYWRTSDEEPWNTITTGSAKYILAPALTFPTYSTVTWYIEATDTGGYTAVSDTYQFTTPTVKINAVIYPEGSDISTKVTHAFQWVYSDRLYTDYSQQSAVFYWQKIPSEGYNEIPISGNIKRLVIPANTFPTSSKIRWYVEGTDAGGTTTRTGNKTFDTVTTRITPQNCPTSGYCDPRNPITFSWYYSSALGEYTQQSAVFYWREAGDEEWTEISISGDIQTLTIPANTFPVASAVEWYLAGTDTGGTTTMTEQYSFSTTAATAYAICVSPIGQVEDGTKPITLTWIVRNDDGSLPLRTVLEWKYDTESQLEWKTLLDTVNTDTEFTVPADTFSAGAVEWRVSAFNRDLIQGPYNVASFVCLHSPEAPAGLAATPVPRTTVRWQAAGQEAYEVVIDGKTVAKEYGPGTYTYQQNEPLEDGEHVIRVRVQGQFGLWSNWSETTILVQNEPGNAIQLSGVFGIDAQLVWSVSSEDPDATTNVYRDGKWIATLQNTLDFTDRLALGEHSYFVELWESDGNYSRSNTVTGTMATEATVIAETAGGDWMEINLSEKEGNRGSFFWQLEYAAKNVLGSAYPIIEVGKSITLTGSYECNFTEAEEARKFEALRGKSVIIKSHRDNMMSGVITNLDKQPSHFYINYTFTLQQDSLEDFIGHET